MDYEEISKIFYEQLKDELERRPMTAAELNNPMNHDKKEALFNAIFCYDEKDQLCGFNIQPRIEENEIYKLRFYSLKISFSQNCSLVYSLMSAINIS